MDPLEASRRTSLGTFPDPLQPTGPWDFGAWALPATTLSIASASVFALVWAFLQHDGEMRELFVLPFPWGLVGAAAAAALAWRLAWRCRSRPGRLAPRLWALLLALTTSASALGVLAEGLNPRRSWLHALVIAGLAATLTLSPRLSRLHPNHPMVRYIAPLSLLATLLVMPPAADVLGRMVVAGERRRLAARIDEIRRATLLIHQASTYEWQRLAEDPGAASREVERLSPLALAPILRDSDLWRVALVLHREEDLASAVEDLLRTLAGGLDPRRAPRVSSLPEPSVYWDRAAGQWQQSASFSRASAVIGSYHYEVGRLFTETATALPPPRSPAQGKLQQAARALGAEVDQRLRAALDTWADNWVVFEVPGHEKLVGGDREPLATVLRAPLTAGQPSLAAADLTRLTRLPLVTARQVAEHAPGCRLRSYAEQDRSYVRLDCYSYAPRAEDRGAELSVELRLVYQSKPGASVAEHDAPEEVYFLFPLPPATATASFRRDVMSALAEAVRRREGIPIESLDRGGAVATGFRLAGSDGSSVIVHPPHLQRLPEGKVAVEVRAQRRPTRVARAAAFLGVIR